MKKECPFKTFNQQVVYCNGEDCAVYNSTLGCCDPTGLIGILSNFMEEFGAKGSS